ncbi:MAG TPA: tripartite tricarboxylate transporter substrate binding protein [Burkholderiales bacterium]|jgi:tripartite-type tricarboxylate transporter receptor subunit TctC|nr:tripartite tricarboxylate transporter substrate binding protein [Burkholderiales bacterium]
MPPIAGPRGGMSTMRALLKTLGLLLALGALAPGHALAQSWPSRSIRLVVPFSPGAGTDALSRILATRLSDSLGQPVVVDNRPGAGGTIGTEIVAKAAGDGYTLLFAPAAHAINPSIYPKLGYDTEKDFVPISIAASLPVVMAVEASVPARSVAELVALAKTSPGKLTMASAGNGTVFHLTGEMFKGAAGIDIVHVPYKGGAPAMAALVGGQVTMAFETSLTVSPHIKSGKLRGLAVASPARIAILPEVPTLAQAGYPGILSENWYGLYAPAGTPKEVVARIYADLAKAIADPEIRQKFALQGAETRELNPEQSAEFVRAEIAKWARVVKASGAKID